MKMKSVKSKDEVVKNIRAYVAALQAGNKVALYLLKMGRNFVVVKNNDDADLFCPSKFAGYANNDIGKYLVWRKKSANGGQTDETINKISRLIGRGDYSPSRKLDARLETFCGDYQVEANFARKSKRKYWDWS